VESVSLPVPSSWSCCWRMHEQVLHVPLHVTDYSPVALTDFLSWTAHNIQYTNGYEKSLIPICMKKHIKNAYLYNNVIYTNCRSTKSQNYQPSLPAEFSNTATEIISFLPSFFYAFPFVSVLRVITTRNSAVAERPRNVLCYSVFR